MTVTVKLITEQTTNLLVDSVNKAQASNWYPVCGVVYFNARYTQLMAQDTDITTPPACGYFIVDSEDGIDFANRVNKLVALNSGAVCLSSVQYVNARYIQAWGDDSLHNGGGGSGGDALKWYTENAAKTGPIIDTDTNLPEIGLGNEWAGYLMLKFITGGNSAGYLHADDGTLTLARPNGTYLSMTDNNYNLLVDNVSVLNSDSRYTNLIAQGSALTLAPGFAGITSPAGALEMDETRGIKLYGNGGVSSIIDADPTQATFGDLAAAANINGGTITVNGGNRTTLEMDANALRVKRGTNNLFSISDSSGAMTWNSMIRCVWNADGWNVSRDTGVAFSSRATYSVMLGPNDSRVEANATGLMLSSNIYNATASKLTMINASTIGNVGTSEWLNVTPTDTTINALAGNVTFNALGQSMSIGPAGLRYTVDGVDVIQSGSAASRSAPDLTIRRPGGGDMMLDMTDSSARLQTHPTIYVDVGVNTITSKIGNSSINLMSADYSTHNYYAGMRMNAWSKQVMEFRPDSSAIQHTDGGHTSSLTVKGGATTSLNASSPLGLAVTASGVASITANADNVNTLHGNNSVTVASDVITVNTDSLPRLTFTADGQITAATDYAPLTDPDLTTKQYVDTAVAGVGGPATVGTYDVSTATANVVPGKSVYYSSSSAATSNLVMYLPSAGPTDVTIMAPAGQSLSVHSPAGGLFHLDAITTGSVTVQAGTFVRFIALSATDWLAMRSVS